jgi:hypothetical protein
MSVKVGDSATIANAAKVTCIKYMPTHDADYRMPAIERLINELNGGDYAMTADGAVVKIEGVVHEDTSNRVPKVGDTIAPQDDTIWEIVRVRGNNLLARLVNHPETYTRRQKGDMIVFHADELGLIADFKVKQ